MFNISNSTSALSFSQVGYTGIEQHSKEMLTFTDKEVFSSDNQEFQGKYIGWTLVLENYEMELRRP